MNISKVIKDERARLALSQEELGEQVYVTRQTISNWENGKSYPDIHSLILLSQAFGITIDALVKGDLKMMEQKIEANDIRKMKTGIVLQAVFTLLGGLGIATSWYLEFIPGFFIAGPFVIAAFFLQFQLAKIQKQYDVQTYREIVAFCKGETLDEIAKLRESGKRGYQKFLLVLGSALFGILASLIIWYILQS